MNKDKRRRLSVAQSFISEAKSLIESVRDEEQESIMNLPENLEASDRAASMEEAVENLESAITALEEAEGALQDAKS